MQIKVPEVDLRRDSGGSCSIDDENGNLVGQLLMEKSRGRTIVLTEGILRRSRNAKRLRTAYKLF